MGIENKYTHIKVATEFSDLIRSTLGPKGMNKMVIDESNNTIVLTNDGATIVNSLRGGNPIVQIFKNLAKSQEEAIGDGTTTAVILAGQLLKNALILLEKGVHPTTIINGYTYAKMEAMRFIDGEKIPGEKKAVIKTAFGTKLSEDISTKLTDLLMEINDYQNLQVFRMNNSDPLESEIYNGQIYEGFTLNDRMKSEINGNIAVLDFKINLNVEQFSVTNAEELEKIQKYNSEYKRKIVDKLKEKNVECIFYTDTTPEFEMYLTEQGITGIFICQRDIMENICKAVNCQIISNIDYLADIHIGKGHIKYVKPTITHQKDGIIYIDGEIETLILKGSTSQVLDEMNRALSDAISLLRNDISMVVGAGAIEMETAISVRSIEKRFGGKEQLAISQFADALEVIPSILAENCGLDAIEVLTALKTMHANGMKNMGVDIVKGISDAGDRGIYEPYLIKIHAINSATNVACLILKLDNILMGQMDK